MTTKKIISLLFFLTFQFKSFSHDIDQSLFSKSITSLMSFVKELNNNLTEINDRENLKKLYRILGNITIELEKISTQKIIIGNKITKNPNYQPTEDVENQINELVKNIKFLKQSFNELVPFIVQANQDDFIFTINTLDKRFEPNRDFWIEIKNYIYNQRQLQAEIKESVKLNNEALLILKDIRKIIRERLKQEVVK